MRSRSVNRATGLRRHYSQRATEVRSAHRDDPDSDARAAVILPDNVLFEGVSGRLGESACSPTSTSTPCSGCRTACSIAQGVKANVLLFFDKKPGEQPWTARLWVYDPRTLKQNPLRRDTCRTSSVDCFAPGEPRTDSVRASPYGRKLESCRARSRQLLARRRPFPRSSRRSFSGPTTVLGVRTVALQ